MQVNQSMVLLAQYNTRVTELYSCAVFLNVVQKHYSVDTCMYCLCFRAKFATVEQDYMLLAVAVIASTSYILNQTLTHRVGIHTSTIHLSVMCPVA